VNINNPTTFGTPSLTLSTSNSSGTGGALRSDDTILVYDTTVPTTIASGASAAVGDVATAARRNHTHGMYTTTVAASVAEEEAASSTTVYTSPGRQKSHPGVAKVWGQFQVDGTVNGSYNLSSVTFNASGNWSPAFIADFSAGTYSIAGGFDDDSNTLLAMNYESFAVGSVNMRIRNDADTLTNPSDFVTFMAMGDQ